VRTLKILTFLTLPLKSPLKPTNVASPWGSMLCCVHDASCEVYVSAVCKACWFQLWDERRVLSTSTERVFHNVLGIRKFIKICMNSISLQNAFGKRSGIRNIQSQAVKPFYGTKSKFCLRPVVKCAL
jgi:hypothetical protein